MKLTRRHIQDRSSKKAEKGLAMPEVLVSSAILAMTVAMSTQLSNSSMVAMGQSERRSKVDIAISERIESLRAHAFKYECLPQSGCHEDHLTKALAYGTDLEAFKQACANKTLGNDLRDSIEAEDPDLLSSFTIPGTNIEVSSTVLGSGNQMNVVLHAGEVGTTFSATIVPMAQGWCP